MGVELEDVKDLVLAHSALEASREGVDGVAERGRYYRSAGIQDVERPNFFSNPRHTGLTAGSKSNIFGRDTNV